MTLAYFLRLFCPKQLYAYSTKVRLPQSRIDFRKFLIARWLLQKGGSVIDGGAHIGYYTRYFSEVIKENNFVYSFEPNPYIFKLINKYARCRKNVIAHQKALSNQNTTCSFYVQPFSLSQDSNLTAGRKGQKKVEVATGKLDDIIEASAQISLIKLDVEGHELQALLGAQQLIHRCRPWIIFEYVQNKERSDEKMINLLKEWGYQCMDLENLEALPNSRPIDLTDGVAFPQEVAPTALQFIKNLECF